VPARVRMRISTDIIRVKEALNNKHLPTNFLIRFDFGAYLVQ
jgi:hypothetical protein